jgi:hypothetical protein
LGFISVLNHDSWIFVYNKYQNGFVIPSRK